MKKYLLLVIAVSLFSCNGNAQKNEVAKAQDFEITKTEAEWKEILTPAEYYVLREAGTERPYSSELNNIKEEGIYVCAACNNELYSSEHKFESGTGWPSFDRAIDGGVEMGSDMKIGYPRDEIHCAKCGGHLGHMFNDGPQETTGKRHCMNGVAMKFIPSKQ